MIFNILDTSAIIAKPDVFTTMYHDEYIVLSDMVFEELDILKGNSGNKGFNARQALRILSDDIVALEEPVPDVCSGKATMFQAKDNPHAPKILFFPLEFPGLEDAREVYDTDRYLVALGFKLQERLHSTDVVNIITQDKAILVRTKLLQGSVDSTRATLAASSLELDDNGKELSSGVITLDVSPDVINEMYRTNMTSIDDSIPVNTGVIFRSGNQSAIGISDGGGTARLIDDCVYMSGVRPRGARQAIAANHLMGSHYYDTEFLGSLSGRAGSGKTMLALAAGLERVSNGEYSRIIVFRPTETVGRDLGFLPGTMEEKMEPWKKAIDDVLRAIGVEDSISIGKGRRNHVPVEDIVSVESINHVRGRTLNDSFVIIDEAQNLEYDVLRTVLSRLGSGSAAVLTWDASQIDNPFLSNSGTSTPEGLLRDIMPNKAVWNITLNRPERGGVSALIP